MCTNSAISRDCNISLNLLRTRPSLCKLFLFWKFADEGQVSSISNDMLQSLEIALFLRTKKTRLLRG